MIDRRGFLRGVTAALIGTPLAVRAQTVPKVRRIGTLAPDSPRGTNNLQDEWVALRDLGWVEGRNLSIERRWANSKAELLPQLAEELVRLKVEVIVAVGTDATLAAKNATKSIPIVMVVGDPIALGLVESLAHPGGNITGYSIVAPELEGKRVALMHELLPSVQRVALLVNPNTGSRFWSKVTERAYQSLGLQPIIIEAGEAKAVTDAVAEAARHRAQAIDIIADDLFYENRAAIMSAAMKGALPVAVWGRGMLEAGGLMSYDANIDDLLARTAAFVDKILRGAKPADLPIEQPRRFTLGLNLKTAKALGITVPQSVLLRADEVIQ